MKLQATNTELFKLDDSKNLIKIDFTPRTLDTNLTSYLKTSLSALQELDNAFDNLANIANGTCKAIINLSSILKYPIHQDAYRKRRLKCRNTRFRK